MKKLILILFIAMLFVSCGGVSKTDCYESVKKEFPEALDIITPISRNYVYIVVDKDSFIYYIETMDLFTSDITSKQLIFK